jgi:hypothetical protein
MEATKSQKAIQRIIPHIFFCLMALFVLIPLGTSGYFFSLDLVPYARDVRAVGISFSQYGTSVPYIPFTLLRFVLPDYVVQRIFLFVCLYLAGISAYYLAPKGIAGYYAGILYAVNPFTYVRIVAGQWSLLLPYSLLPLSLLLLNRAIEKKSYKTGALFSLVSCVIAGNSHILFLGSILWTLFVIISAFRGFKLNINPIKVGVFCALVSFFLNFYWIMPAVSSPGVVETVTLADLAEFAPKSKYPIYLALAGMYGFWRPYATAELFAGWPVLLFIMLFISVYGAVSRWRDEKIGNTVKAVAIAGIIGFLLSLSIWFAPSAWILSQGIMRGMRDSHKFVVLLALAYSYLGAIGIKEIGRRWSVVFLLVPLIYSYPMFTGFQGQLVPTDFPKDWYDVRSYLDSKGYDYRVLFLPWHGYMDFSWIKNADKRICAPAAGFFNQRVIQASNVEIVGKYRERATPEQIFLDYIVFNGDKIGNMDEMLSLLNIRYVILAKEADYKSYSFLFKKLKLVKETEHLYLFENPSWFGVAFQTDGISYLSKPEQLINKTITDRLYVFGNGTNSGPSGRYALKVEWTGSGYKLLEKPKKKYIVITEPFSENWIYDEKKPIPAYGVITAFEADGQTDITVKVNYVPYTVSTVVLVGVLLYLSPLRIEIEIEREKREEEEAEK